MDFIDQIKDLAARKTKQLDHVETEEATKNALVMPFIQALGYNVFDPREVVPEFTADVGAKKGEKVDYAILKDGKPIILFECKWSGADLDKEHASQLRRYFSVTEARFGVLTNGLIYRFFSDLEDKNKMDSRPFLEFDLGNIQEPLIDELKRFTKGAFDLQDILTTAADLKYTREIKRVMTDELSNPSETFVRFFAGNVYSGRLTQGVMEQFTAITKRALQQFIHDRINDRLRHALDQDETTTATGTLAEEQLAEDGEGIQEKGSQVVTTEDEIEAYYIVKSILRETVDANRVAMRDRKSYCNILLDDNQRKPICRLHFDSPKRRIGFFDAQKNEELLPLSDLNEIFGYADRLKATVGYYEKPGASPDTAG